ncbi:MAG: hypothetical protein HUJ57_04335, partial [Erysipelotrichaceae bacterium]|nr:hypothetical protein [Erysipelotrichaceae bacterium]
TSKDKLDIKVTLNEKVYTLYTEDELVKLSVTDAPKPTPTPTPTPSPTPTITPTAANRLVQGIDSFRYKDDNKTIEVKGFAFIAGVDAVETKDITQKMYLDNGTDTIEFNLTTTKVATPIFMNDGHTYSMVGYTAELDMTSVPEGNYVMRLEVQAGGMTKKAALMDQINDFYPPQITSADNLSVRFLKNSLYSYRYEVIVEKNELDFSTINKPTLRNSGFGMDSFVLSEGKMKVSGQAWMYNVNFSTTTNPKQTLVLIDKDGKATRYAMTNQKCAIDYTKLLKTKFNWDNICYQIEGDISTLDAGTYRIYLEVSADGKKDLYRAANNFGTTIKSMTYNNRTYEIQTESDTEYMNLIIK